MSARNAMLPVVDYVTRDAREAGRRGGLRAPAVPAVREAGQPGVVGGDFEGAQSRRNWRRPWRWRRSTTARSSSSAASWAANWSARCWATRRPMASLPCEILPSREFYDYEDKYLLDQRRRPSCPRTCRRNRPPSCGGWPWMLPRGGMRRHGARRFPAGSRHRQALHQRDQHHSRVHLASACIPRCGSTAASPFPRCWTG